MSESLRKQGNALENQFFQQVDLQLLEQIRKNLESVPRREALATVSNLKDAKVLDALLALDIDAATFAALTYVPLAAVAWVDGALDAKERAAILAAAEQHGVHAGKPGYQLLEQWLQKPPEPAIIATWLDYVAALKKEADPAWFATLRNEVIGLAEKVAQASGGILGLVMTYSAAEKAKVSEFAQAFDS